MILNKIKSKIEGKCYFILYEDIFDVLNWQFKSTKTIKTLDKILGFSAKLKISFMSKIAKSIPDSRRNYGFFFD